MALPTSREEFKEYCLRELGKPAMQINVPDDQLEDRIDYALAYYKEYHFDGSDKTYYKHQITSTDIANEYITIPENIFGVVRVFDIGFSRYSSGSIFNLQYQIALNDLYTLVSQSLLPYWITMQQLANIEEILVGHQPIRYNKHRNRLHIDMDWSKVREGDYLVVEAHDVVDPEQYTDVWADIWLLKYATQLIKRQWGTNLGKFQNVQMLGGVTFNGEQIYQQADEVIRQMEDSMIHNVPIGFYTG